jgi:hypothetical protein
MKSYLDGDQEDTGLPELAGLLGSYFSASMRLDMVSYNSLYC